MNIESGRISCSKVTSYKSLARLSPVDYRRIKQVVEFCRYDSLQIEDQR